MTFPKSEEQGSRMTSGVMDNHSGKGEGYRKKSWGTCLSCACVRGIVGKDMIR